MKLIGAGFPRTGTLSQKIALEMLGSGRVTTWSRCWPTCRRPHCGIERSTATPRGLTVRRLRLDRRLAGRLLLQGADGSVSRRQGPAQHARLLWTGNGSFAAGHAEPGQLTEGMHRHEDEVKRTVAPERLLVWNVAMGWEPLCEFLEVAVPDMPFPRVNDSREFVDRLVDGALITLTERRAKAAEEPSPAAAR